jgi:hypothetical protein
VRSHSPYRRKQERLDEIEEGLREELRLSKNAFKRRFLISSGDD